MFQGNQCGFHPSQAESRVGEEGTEVLSWPVYCQMVSCPPSGLDRCLMMTLFLGGFLQWTLCSPPRIWMKDSFSPAVSLRQLLFFWGFTVY